jgi:hypothetical protein
MPPELLKEYDTALDTKRRFTIRSMPKPFKYYHVRIFKDGRILMEPRVLVEPKYLSKRTLRMMDRAIANYAGGIKNGPIDMDELRKIADAL